MADISVEDVAMKDVPSNSQGKFQWLASCSMDQKIKIFHDEIVLLSTSDDFLPMMKVLLNSGVEINYHFEDRGNTFLHFAVEQRDLEAIYYLLNQNANAYAINDLLEIPFTIAAKNKYREIEEILLDWTFDEYPMWEYTKAIIWSAKNQSPHFSEIISRVKILDFDQSDCYLLQNNMRTIVIENLAPLFYNYPEFPCYMLNSVCNNRVFWNDVIGDEDLLFIEFLELFLETQEDFLKYEFDCIPIFHALCERYFELDELQSVIRFFLSFGGDAFAEDFENCVFCLQTGLWHGVFMNEFLSLRLAYR